MRYPNGTRVTTKRGEGTIIDFKSTPIDGNCYCVQLNDGSKIWRTANTVHPVLEWVAEATTIAQLIADRFNLDADEVETVIRLSV